MFVCKDLLFAVLIDIMTSSSKIAIVSGQRGREMNVHQAVSQPHVQGSNSKRTLEQRVDLAS